MVGGEVAQIFTCVPSLVELARNEGRKTLSQWVVEGAIVTVTCCFLDSAVHDRHRQPRSSSIPYNRQVMSTAAVDRPRPSPPGCSDHYARRRGGQKWQHPLDARREDQRSNIHAAVVD